MSHLQHVRGSEISIDHHKKPTQLSFWLKSLTFFLPLTPETIACHLFLSRHVLLRHNAKINVNVQRVQYVTTTDDLTETLFEYDRLLAH